MVAFVLNTTEIPSYLVYPSYLSVYDGKIHRIYNSNYIIINNQVKREYDVENNKYDGDFCRI